MITPQVPAGRASSKLNPDFLVRGLVRIGEDGIAKENEAALDSYYTPDFVFHGPNGDMSLKELRAYFAAMRKSFSGFTVTRDAIIVQGNIVAARTKMAGVFEHEFPYTAVGAVQPNGKPVSFYIHNFFRYDNDGRLAEEWAELDNLEFLKQLGVELPAGSNAKTVRDIIANVFNQHDPDAIARYYAPDMKWHGGSVGSIDGATTYAKVMREFFAALPDAHATEKDVMEYGNSVAARFVVEGTHRGNLWGMPATGRRVKWDAIMIYRFEGGRVVEQWAAEDWTAILQGVGAITPPWARGGK